MTAPDSTPDSTPDSRTTVTAGQAAYEAHAAMLVPRPWRWDQLDDKLRAAWEAAATAAIAAAAPAPAGEARLLNAKQERQPSREVNLITDDERNLTQMHLTLPDTGQPQAAPDLTARLAAVTALLDASHKRDWDSGLASEQERVADERAGLGMGAL